MKKTAYSLFVLAILLSTSFGCKKSATVTFAVDNKYGPVPINVDIYTSKSDYINKTNVLQHATIDSGGTYSFLSSTLNYGNRYYVDAYSSDYTYTNWGYSDNNIAGEDSASGLTFKYNGSDNRYEIRTLHTMARNVLIQNTGITAKWRAIGALDINDGTDQWGALTAEQKDLEIVINKDHTGEYRYMSGLIADTLRFTFLNTQITGHPIFKMQPDNNTINTYIENANLHPVINSDRFPTRDTILSLFRGYMYLLTRN